MSNSLIEAIQFLLPGFLAAWVFYNLAPNTKETQFERLIDALILTAFIKLIVIVYREIAFWAANFLQFHLADWTPEVEWTISASFGLILGVLLSINEKCDFTYSCLRKFKLTNSSGTSSVWAKVLTTNKSWVTLHLEDGRVLMGRIHYWSNALDEDFIDLHDAIWIQAAETSQPTTIHRMLISVKKIELIEFIENGNTDDQKQAASTAAVS